MNSRKIAIIGAGAIGSYYGALLAWAGQDVRFLMRSDLEAVRKNGLRVEEEGKETFVLKPAKAYGTTAEIGACDLVIIALKATANEALVELIPPLLKKDTILLTLQNGLGNEAFLGEHFGKERVVGGLCFICANRLAPGVVKSFYPGYIVIGEPESRPRDRTRRLAEMWKEAGVKCHLAESLEEARWRKLCWNVPFNGLSIAAGGIDTEALLARKGMTELVLELMREIQAIASAAGHEIEDEFLQKQIDVTYGMGPYRPSSLIDFQLGREVEVEAIWGEAFREAQRLKVPVPRLEMLYYLLLAQCERQTETNES